MSSCPKCAAAVAYLQRLISGAAVACDPAGVRGGDVVFVRSLHREHVCAEPTESKPTGQRSLFGEEES